MDEFKGWVYMDIVGRGPYVRLRKRKAEMNYAVLYNGNIVCSFGREEDAARYTKWQNSDAR